MTSPVFLRASSLSSYHDCPRRAAARLFRSDIEAAGYTLNEPPGGIGASVGTGVHAGASTTLVAKATTGDLGPADVATDAAVEALRTAADRGIIYDRETADLNTAEQQVVRMTRAYRESVAPDIQPIIIEERLEAEVRPGLVLSGQADVIAREPGRVRDLKTGKKIGNHAPQLGAYSLLARSCGIADVHEVAIDYVGRASLKKPQPDPVIVKVPIAAAETAAVNVIRRIDADLRTFREGDAELRVLPGDPWAFPANPQSMLCSAKWCSAHGTAFCREHAVKEEETL